MEAAVMHSNDELTAIWASKGLALTKIQEGLWRLSHQKSRTGIISLEGEYADACEFAAAVADFTDWETYQTRAEIVAIPDLALKMEGLELLFADAEANYVN